MTTDVDAILAMIRERRERLRAIAEQARREHNYVEGTERLGRWNDKTQQLVTDSLSAKEGARFANERYRMWSTTSHPGHDFERKVKDADSGLVALHETIEEDGLRYVRQAPQPAQAQPTQSSEAMESREGDPRRVFVVHGRNKAARDAMFAFLRALGLQPMEWEAAVSLTGHGSPYIGEVLDVAFAHCRAAVILLTGDDEARLRQEYQTGHDPEYERQLTPQPRPNVLFEAGYAFGRYQARTILVELGQTRPISDIAGRHVVRFRGDTAERNTLKTRLQTAGCDVDDRGTDWLQSGDFAAALA